MPFTTYQTNRFVDNFHNKQTLTAGSNIYMALSTTTPVVGGTNFTEPSGNAYARVAVPPANFATASGGAGSNNTTITFPTPTGSWGTVTYAGYYDQSTGGNLLSFAALPAPQAVTTGVVVSLAAGQATDSVA